MMLFPDRRRPSRWQNLLLQASAFATGTLGLLSIANAIGVETARDDVTRRVEHNRIRLEGDARRAQHVGMRTVGYTGEGQAMYEEPTLVMSYDVLPVEPLLDRVRERQERTRDLAGGMLLSLFIMTSTGGRRLAQRGLDNRSQARIVNQARNVSHAAVATMRASAVVHQPVAILSPDNSFAHSAGTPGTATHVGVMRQVAGHTITVPFTTTTLLTQPPAAEVEPTYAEQFEPGTYTSAAYGSEIATLGDMFTHYKPTLTERLVHRISTALAARRERRAVQQAAAPDRLSIAQRIGAALSARREGIAAQLAASADPASYNPYATYHNTIEPPSLIVPPLPLDEPAATRYA